MADEPLDVWLKPYERPNDTKSAMSEYLAWETDLLPRIARDGTTSFSRSSYTTATQSISISNGPGQEGTCRKIRAGDSTENIARILR